MNPPSTHSSHPPPTTLFELAARLDVPPGKASPQPEPAINPETFAALRQEAEHSDPPANPPGRAPAGSDLRFRFPMETVRAAVFQRMLQRKLEADEVFRPEF